MSSKSLLPRVFVLSHTTGGGIELIPPDEYDTYVSRFQGRQGITDCVEDTNSPHVKLHRFVKDYAAVSSTMATLQVSEGAVVAPAQHSQALAALKMPCKSYVAPTTGLVLPRLAAASDPRAYPHPQESVLVVKEFLVHDAPTDGDTEQWEALHTECKRRVDELASSPPEDHAQVAVLHWSRLQKQAQQTAGVSHCTVVPFQTQHGCFLCLQIQLSQLQMF